MAKVTLICGISIALGIAAGVGLNLMKAGDAPAVPKLAIPALESQQPAGNVPQTLQLQTQNVTPAASLDAAQIRAMMREELSGALARQQPTLGGGTAQPKADEPVSPEIQRKSSQAVQEATAMITNNTDWGNDERETFHQKMAFMSAAQQEEVMQKLVQAIDSGALKPSTIGPPL